MQPKRKKDTPSQSLGRLEPYENMEGTAGGNNIGKRVWGRKRFSHENRGQRHVLEEGMCRNEVRRKQTKHKDRRL